VAARLRRQDLLRKEGHRSELRLHAVMDEAVRDARHVGLSGQTFAR
jgi:hypothetical protein